MRFDLILKLNLKVEFNFIISQRKKFFPNDQVFSNWFTLMTKVSIKNCSRNSKSFQSFFFKYESLLKFFKIWKIYSKKYVIFFCLHAIIDFFPTVCSLCSYFLLE